MTNGLTARTVTTLEEFSALKSVWDTLLTTSETNSFFCTFDFLYAWWKTFRNNKQLTIIVVSSGDRICCIAPFYIDKQCLFFIGRPHTDYSDIVCSAQDKQECLPFLLQQLKPLQLKNIILEQIPGKSSTVKLLQANKYTVCPLIECPSMVIAGHETEIQQDQLKKKSLKRHFNHFAKSGELTIEHVTTAEAILPHLENFFTQHIGRWANSNTPSLFGDAVNKEFYKNMITECTKHQQILFSIVRWNNQVIAYHLGFTHNTVFTWYKPTHEAALQDRSPGEVLIKYLLEYAFDKKYGEFDFTRGNEGFKLRFANDIRMNYLAVQKKDLFYFSELAKRWLRQHPKLADYLRILAKKSK